MGKLFAGLGAGSGMAAAAAVVLVLVGVAGWVQYDRNTTQDPATAVAVKPEVKEPAPTAPQTPEPTAEAPQEPADVPATQPETSTDTAQAEAPESAPEQEVVEAAPLPPAFDEVRREQDGAMVIAGRALPGAEVLILLDGSEIATTTADGNGKFAAFTSVPPDGKGHVLTLLQVTAEGSLPSDDQIVLAPLAAPAVVAEVEPEDPQTETEQAPSAETPVVTETEPKEEVQVAVADTSEEPQPKPEPKPEAEAAQSPAKEGESVVAALTPEAQAPVSENTPAQPEEPVVVGTETDQPTSQTTQTATAAPSGDATPAVTAAEAETPQEQTAAAPAASVDTTVADAPQPEPTAVAPVAETAETQPEPDAPARVAVLKTTEDGVALLNPDAPEVMDNVAIDTISYSDTGAVELAGRAQQQAQSVRIYLDNTSVASLPVDAAGNWRGSLPQVDEGIYKLRVDEVAADGTVTSRVETPFKREDPAVLAAASAEQEGPIKAITVQKGATLWAIARDRYGKGELYVRVFEANRSAIRDPDLIYPGQIFDLPD